MLPADPTMLTRGDLANRLQISLPTLHRHVSSGLLPAPIRFGRLVRWPVVVIEDFERGLAGETGPIENQSGE